MPDPDASVTTDDEYAQRKLSQASAASRPDDPRLVFQHDAFISYSRKNEAFASKLEQALERYKPPRQLNRSHPQLRIFRDREDFIAGDYHQNLDRDLEDSAKLIVICSPEARRSTYVNEEIRNFVRLRGADHIIPILFSGIPNNEAESGREEEMAFPQALCDAMQMPLAVNYLGFNPATDNIKGGAFTSSWYTVLANLFGVTRSEVEQRDRKRLARTLAIYAAAASLVIIVLSGLLIWALASRTEAERQRQTAQAQTQLVEAQRQRVESELNRSEHLRYVSDIVLAQQMYRQGNLARAQEMLEAYLEPSRRELRGFEWYYLMGQYHNERATFASPGDPFKAIVFSPDGKTLAARSHDTVKLLDVTSGKELATIGQQSERPMPSPSDTKSRSRPLEYPTGAIGFSADGKTLASSTWVGVKLWDVGSGAELATLGEYENVGSVLEQVAFSTNGKTLAASYVDNRVRLWDLPSRKELGALLGHENIVSAIALTPDGNTLAVASGDNVITQSVRFWDVPSLKPLAKLEYESGRFLVLAFSPNGKMIAAADNYAITLWELASRKQRAPLYGHGKNVTAIAFSPDGRTIAAGDTDNTVKLWDAVSQKVIASLKGHTQKIIAVTFSPDGETLASSSADNTVKLWDIGPGQTTSDLVGHTDDVSAVAFSSDSKTLASGSVDTTVRLWDVATRREVAAPMQNGGAVITVAFSPDSKKLATGNIYNTVKLWDVASGTGLASLDKVTASSMMFSADGRTLFTRDANLRIWDVASRTELAAPKVEKGFSAGAVSSDATMLACVTDNNTIRIQDVASGKELATLTGRAGPIRRVAFSADNKLLAATVDNYGVELWDIASRQQLGTLKGHTGQITAMVFSPDGKTLATASFDRTVKLWDVYTFQELITFEGDIIDKSLNLAFSPDGTMLAAGRSDKTIRLWQGLLPSDTVINFQLHGVR